MPTNETGAKDLGVILEEAIRERDELNTFIRMLQRRMGARDENSVTAPPLPLTAQTGGGDTQPPQSGTDPATVVFPGMFFGKTQSQAAEVLLEAFRRPIKTPKIVPCLRHGGLEMGSKNAVTNLWKTLKRNEDTFVLVPKAGWGLVKWYDPKVIARMRADGANQGENGEDDNGQQD